MKFMVTTTFKDSYYALPADKQAALRAANFAWLDKYLQSGKCQVVYNYADMKGGMSIWEIASSEEGARLTLEYPLFPFVEQKFIPLVELDIAAKVMKDMQAAAQRPA
jgi:muconolactone delta-isomerase